MTSYYGISYDSTDCEPITLESINRFQKPHSYLDAIKFYKVDTRWEITKKIDNFLTRLFRL